MSELVESDPKEQEAEIEERRKEGGRNLVEVEEEAQRLKEVQKRSEVRKRK
jgi:hypothetical protein